MVFRFTGNRKGLLKLTEMCSKQKCDNFILIKDTDIFQLR